ncbi:hypothetical protein [Mycoplasma sp. P36-A1]|uniref:hypothetical protein n=1 Tax=Mycoplasma sp. P36-A1 TaxID=3252900 RepID=UPI003C2F484E
MNILDYSNQSSDIGTIDEFKVELNDVIDKYSEYTIKSNDFIDAKKKECLEFVFNKVIKNTISDEIILNDLYNLALENNIYQTEIIQERYKDALTTLNKSKGENLETSTDFKNMITFLLYKMADNLVTEFESNMSQKTLSLANIIYYLRSVIVIDESNVANFIAEYNECKITL